MFKKLTILGLLFTPNISALTVKTLIKPREVYVNDIERQDSPFAGHEIGDLYKIKKENKDISIEFLKGKNNINALDRLNPDYIAITDKNFEFYNKTKSPVKIALQIVGIGANLNKTIKTKDNKDFEIVEAGKPSEKYHELSTKEVLKELDNNHILTLYLFKDISKEIKRNNALGAGKINNADHEYQFINLRENRNNFSLPVRKKNDASLETIYVTWDGITELRPQTGQFKGKAQKTETGLNLTANIEQKNIKKVK